MQLRWTNQKPLFILYLLFAVLVITISATACGIKTLTSNFLTNFYITWDQAQNHSGGTYYVTGVVVGTSYGTSTSTAQWENLPPTILNIGRDYPDPSRFMVIIDKSNLSEWYNFPSPPGEYYRGKTIRVFGTITYSSFYKAYQIEALSPEQIQVV